MLRTREAAKPTSSAAILKLEQRFGLRFPRSYREFLLSTNGGRPERDLVLVPGCIASPYARVHFFFGVGDTVESCDLVWNIDTRGALLSDLVPIATTEGADIFCLTPTGGVVFWDGYEKRCYPVTDDFESFLAQLYTDELSPKFSEAGTNEDERN